MDEAQTRWVLVIMAVGCLVLGHLLLGVSRDLCERSGGFFVDRGCGRAECIYSGGR